MTAFRILDPFQVYTDLTGKLAAGGNLHFYEAGTTTDADVYGDEALSVNNGATIDIGTDGRAADDIWGDGTLSYRCRVYGADGTLIRDRDNIGLPGSGGLTIPELYASKFLTNDGTSLLWSAIRQALDPSGAANKIMGSDGTDLIWVDKPSDGSAGTNASVSVSTTATTIGDGTDDELFIQSGTGSAPASGTNNTQTSITFPTEFKTLSAAPLVIPTIAGITGGGYNGVPAITSSSTTAFTVEFATNAGSGAPTINADVTFVWIAFGTKAAPSS